MMRLEDRFKSVLLRVLTGTACEFILWWRGRETKVIFKPKIYMIRFGF